MQTLELQVQGMTCGGCAKSVQKVLSALDGVSQVEVDWQAGLARLIFDPAKIEQAALIEAIEEAGFEASLS
ncbi:hypothetical protein A4G20_10700 [Pasteurellaceae bacterium RH1A]|nr:hypothetical protein A4G20_10700 [Pasteurellaceae bacterium RH1A]